ncbi:MAG: SAM-dependent methyltransferase, partial [bacterium]|nr:SAM-dependent methyltransferase [bacterium]
ERKIDRVDYIVSGLPFASLPSDVSTTILEATQRVIGEHGKFITFQYTLFKKGVFLNYFDIATINYEYKNLPPAFVLMMKNKQYEKVRREL